MKCAFFAALVLFVSSAAHADNLNFVNGSSIVDQGNSYHVTVAAGSTDLWGSTVDPIKGYVFDIPKSQCSGDACRSGGPIKAIEQHGNNVGRVVPMTVSYSISNTSPAILSVTFQNTFGQTQTVLDKEVVQTPAPTAAK